MLIRSTTNSVLKGYKSNLMRSFTTLNKSRNTVLTQRNFVSYAEDPAAAAQSFQLRRSFARVDGQYGVNVSTSRKFDVAWSALDTVGKAIDTGVSNNTAWKDVLAGASDTSGSGRAPLGKSLTQLADSIVQTMNCKYGDTFVFAGADGLKVPFTWDGEGPDRKLCYRGVPVDALANSPDLDKLDYMSEEGRYVDIGLGLQEDENGNLIKSSAFNDALQGINFLGYGVDQDGDPKNVVSIIQRMGTILSNCSDDGHWASPDEQEEFARLAEKFEKASAKFKESYVEMDAQTQFLKKNETQLKATAATLNEQILGIEQCDLVDAIMSFSWAQYSYNAALKMGNSILSQSLMDYLQ